MKPGKVQKWVLIVTFATIIVATAYYTKQQRDHSAASVPEKISTTTTPDSVVSDSDQQNLDHHPDSHVSQNNISTASSDHTAPVKVIAPPDSCFVAEYKHKPEAKQKDIEEFLDYSNAFPIEHTDYNAKTMCVKVNNQVVPFTITKTKNKSEVLVGSVVGPDSVIRVSYCTGKTVCKETCAQPKKRFIDNMMDDSLVSEEFGDSEDSKKLHENVKAFRTIASKNESIIQASIMRDWVTLSNNINTQCTKGK